MMQPLPSWPGSEHLRSSRRTCGKAMKPTLRAIALTGLIFSSASAQNVNRDAIQRPEGLYEVFVRDFSPAGNFKGVTAGLDRIQATGADVVWLMPIYPIGKVTVSYTHLRAHETPEHLVCR